MREAVLRIAALFSYRGGPLFIADVWKPRLNGVPAFLKTFLPVGFMVIGALFLNDATHDRTSFAAVWAGRQGLYIVLGMHVYALWCFVDGVHVPDQSLHCRRGGVEHRLPACGTPLGVTTPWFISCG